MPAFHTIKAGDILNGFQSACLRTAKIDRQPVDVSLSSFGLGIAGEAGEVADLIKKHLDALDAREAEVERLRRVLAMVIQEVAELHAEPLHARVENALYHAGHHKLSGELADIFNMREKGAAELLEALDDNETNKGESK